VLERPDILVLGGGGRQGDAWMSGVLAGIEDAHGLDLRECEYFVGTSAGSIVAAKLATGRRLRRPEDKDRAAKTSTPAPPAPPLVAWAGELALGVCGPICALALAAGRAPGEALRGMALRAIGTDAFDALDFGGAFEQEFDGRLRLVAVERASGRRVVFGAPGAPAASIEQAMTASCSLPRTFPPTVIGGREYVDGAVWSMTNADAAPVSRDARVLVLAPMASAHGPFNAPVRLIARARLAVELAALAPAAEIDHPFVRSERLLAASLAVTFVALLLLARMLAQLALVSPLTRLARDARSSGTDELTSLPNRRAFAEAAAAELVRSRRTGRSLAVALIDIDDFKRVNDTFGHAAGDRILCEVADVLRGQFRGIDLPARFGGEEFAVLLPETDLTGAAEAVERFISALARQEFGDGRTRPFRITASAGVAAAPDRDVQELLEAADGALYQAKALGKNQVRAASPEASPGLDDRRGLTS